MWKTMFRKIEWGGALSRRKISSNHWNMMFGETHNIHRLPQYFESISFHAKQFVMASRSTRSSSTRDVAEDSAQKLADGRRCHVEEFIAIIRT
jgi:hypothetical protein